MGVGVFEGFLIGLYKVEVVQGVRDFSCVSVSRNTEARSLLYHRVGRLHSSGS